MYMYDVKTILLANPCLENWPQNYEADFFFWQDQAWRGIAMLKPSL